MPGTASRLIPPKTSSSVPHDDRYPPAGASADRTGRRPWSIYLEDSSGLLWVISAGEPALTVSSLYVNTYRRCW